MGVAEVRTVFGDRYEVRSVLGHGGMGDVYAVHDRKLDRLVALKALRSAPLPHSTALTRFLREARAVASLKHPGLVTVFDVADTADPPYIVMELVPGESLEALLRREGTVDPAKAATIAAEIADAIGAAHEAGVVHRDLKPSNVMVTPAGKVKVLDFGIANATAWTPLTSRKVVQGTVEYISPEQARGEDLDGRSDLYSLGVLLYEMLLGRPPFINENPVTLLYKHLEERPQDPSEIDPRVPKPLADLVLRTLEKSRELRPSSAAEMSKALRALDHPPTSVRVPHGAPVTARTRTQASTARLPRARSRPLALITALAASALALGVFVPSVLGGEEKRRSPKPVPPALEAPSDLALSSACSGFTTAAATLTWSPSLSQGVDGYIVSRSTEGGPYEELAQIDGQAASGAVDDGLATGTNYHFKVQAVSGERRSGYSAIAAIGTPILCMW